MQEHPDLLSRVLFFVENATPGCSFREAEKLVQELRALRAGAAPGADELEASKAEESEYPMLRLVTDETRHPAGEAFCRFAWDHETDGFVVFKDVWEQAAKEACPNDGDCSCIVHTYFIDGEEMHLREGIFQSREAFYMKPVNP